MKAPNSPHERCVTGTPTRGTPFSFSNQPEANQGLKTMELKMGFNIFGSRLGQMAQALWLAFSARLEHVLVFLEVLVQGPLARPAFVGAWPQPLFEPARPTWLAVRESSRERLPSRMTWAASQALNPGSAPQPSCTPEASQARAPQSRGAAHKTAKLEPKKEPVSSEAWVIIRDILYASKVISLSLVGLFVAGSLVWIFGFGQPKYLYLAAVQVVNCGIMSEVENPWTCDKN